jgi:hypothetical protein
MSPTTSTGTATPKQINYLKLLAGQTGTSFTYPKTGSEAKHEIDRLLALKKSGVAPLPIPANDGASDLVYATAVQPGEVVGFGSTASWRKDAPEETVQPAAPAPRVGRLTEIDRYTVSGGERVVYAQRIKGSVRITDRPALGSGRSYLVERELEEDGYSALKSLVADYIEQARELDAIPMANSILRRQLQRVAA